MHPTPMKNCYDDDDDKATWQNSEFQDAFLRTLWRKFGG